MSPTLRRTASVAWIGEDVAHVKATIIALVEAPDRGTNGEADSPSASAIVDEHVASSDRGTGGEAGYLEPAISTSH